MKNFLLLATEWWFYFLKVYCDTE